MNNTSRKNIAANTTSSKVTSPSSKKNNYKTERKRRESSYRNKFNHPHMIIPVEDFKWLKNQNNSVKILFMECWMSDPYGSRWQVLNHTLKPSSFKTAKKILSEAGLFTFRTQQSIRDSRETVCWEVMNLHGARRNDYWLGQNSDSSEKKKIEAKNLTQKVNQLTSEANQLTLEANQLTSIKSQTQSEQGFQNHSGDSQEHLSNSSKELLEVLPVKSETNVDGEESDRDRDQAFEGLVASASLQTEMEGNSDTKLNGCVDDSKIETKTNNSVLPEDNFSAAALNKTSNLEDAPSNLPLEADENSKEQIRATWKFLSELGAKLKQQEKQKRQEREEQIRSEKMKRLD